ncbi:MAG: sulfatase-like hydrolase/transferase, partial [Succinivibrio sp.]|nr:sulfatase-like hydrolase/transferase [Succinivibrio sp.]
VDVLGNLEYYVRLFSSSPITNDLVPIAKYLGIAKNKTNFVTSDEAVFTNAKEFINSLASNQHFILNLNTSSLEKNLNDAQRKIALRQLDNQIATFVEELQDKELLNNTYVVITSSLGNSNIEKQYANFYSIKKQHVPLIVITPNESNKGVSITKLTSAFDFVPTLGIEILGIKTPYVNYAIGNNLFSKEEKPYFVSTGGNELLLISKEKVTNYKKNGKAYIFKDGTKQNARTNLEDLIKAMRELNRFKG